MEAENLHFHIAPTQSTRELVESAPVDNPETGTRAVVEITGYPDGHFTLVTSRTGGRPRRIKQHQRLNFRDANEAKDALDLLIDRLAGEA